MKNYINKDECVKTKGNFALTAGYNSTDIVKTCFDGNSSCIFNNVNTLSDAIKLCDLNNLCEKFTYSYFTKTMNIINNSNNLTPDNTTDIYSRQN